MDKALGICASLARRARTTFEVLGDPSVSKKKQSVNGHGNLDEIWSTKNTLRAGVGVTKQGALFDVMAMVVTWSAKMYSIKYRC